MDETKPPAELTLEEWEATPPRVRTLIHLLETRLAELEARLNQNSNNSSKPPSSDPPSAPPRPSKTPRGKPKTKGAQPGHPDQQRELVPVSEVDELVPVYPTACPQCEQALSPELRSIGLPIREQLFALPEVKPIVTEYQRHSVCCPGCGDFVTAPRPEHLPPGCFSPGVVALIALLHGRFRLSHREVVSYLQLVWRLPISVGSVLNLQQVASSALAPALEELQAVIEQAEHLNVDETSWREGKLKPWLGVAVSACATLFLLQYGRGKKQLR